MTDLTEIAVGHVALKNPLIAGSAEHLIDAEGVRCALRTGVGAVVVKSVNETRTGRDQLQRAEYRVLDARWREVPWGPQAPAHAVIACRSGLSPLSFDAWLDDTAMLDREAKTYEARAEAPASSRFSLKQRSKNGGRSSRPPTLPLMPA